MECFHFASMQPQKSEDTVVINSGTHLWHALNTAWRAAWQRFYGIQFSVPCSIIVYLPYKIPDRA